MVIPSASVPGYYYQNISYSHYKGASPSSPNLLHRTVKFLLKKGKNGCSETWCFQSNLALRHTLEMVCVCVCVCKNHIIYNTIFTESLAATNKRQNYSKLCFLLQEKFIFFTVIKKKFKKLTKNKLQVRPHNLNNKIQEEKYFSMYSTDKFIKGLKKVCIGKKGHSSTCYNDGNSFSNGNKVPLVFLLLIILRLGFKSKSKLEQQHVFQSWRAIQARRDCLEVKVCSTRQKHKPVSTAPKLMLEVPSIF